MNFTVAHKEQNGGIIVITGTDLHVPAPPQVCVCLCVSSTGKISS